MKDDFTRSAQEDQKLHIPVRMPVAGCMVTEDFTRNIAPADMCWGTTAASRNYPDYKVVNITVAGDTPFPTYLTLAEEKQLRDDLSSRNFLYVDTANEPVCVDIMRRFSQVSLLINTARLTQITGDERERDGSIRYSLDFGDDLPVLISVRESALESRQGPDDLRTKQAKILDAFARDLAKRVPGLHLGFGGLNPQSTPPAAKAPASRPEQ